MAMKITSESREFTKAEKYLMTKDSGILTLKDVEDGTLIEVDGVLVFEDEKSNGEVVEILSVIDKNKQVYSCQSATFKRSLNDIMNIMDGEEFAIVKCSGTTKAGRHFIDCRLAI